MKKTFLLFTILLSFGHFLSASPVDTTTAQLAGQLFMNQKVETNRNTGSLQLATRIDNQEQLPCLYIFNREDGGFVIVAADDRVTPILGYSENGHFDAENCSENFRYWLSLYTKAVTEICGLADDPQVRAQWQALLAGETEAPHRDVVVEPLLVTEWSQSPYYNALCPGTSSSRAVTGCAATAMGQIMRFWQHPTQGHGHHGYPCNFAQYGYADYGFLEVDFGSATYDYTLMPSRLNSSSTQEQVNEVAKLLYHCGVSLNMMYSPDGSGASIENAPAALQNYFGYRPSTVYYRSVNANNWVSMLQQELDNGRPVFYAGYGDDGGHAFVCDGYDDADFFHFNWGWQGSGNGYFAVTALNPSYDFTEGQSAVFGLEPDTCYPYEEIQISGDNIMSGQGDQVTLTAPEGDSYHWSNNGTTQSITVSPVVPTLYTVTVTTDGCSNTASQWVSFENACELSIVMHDSYGDGWQGNKIQIYNNVKKIAEAALAEGYTDTLTIPLISGELALRWHTGNYPEECSFEIYLNGNLAYSYEEAPSSGVFLIDSVQCGNNVATPDWNGNQELTIFPNPTNSIVNIRCAQPATALRTVQVMDIFGKCLLSQEMADVAAIDLSEMASGLYFIRLIENGHIVSSTKIVKQ